MNLFLRFLVRVLHAIKFTKIVHLLISNIMEMCKGMWITAKKRTGAVAQGVKQNWSNYMYNPSYQIEEKVESTVPLSPLPFDTEQPTGSEIEFNENRLIATRIGENYQSVFVNIKNSLAPNKFILIQILEVNPLHTGGLRLYVEFARGGRQRLFVDSGCKPYDYIIFWIDNKGEPFSKKGERMSIEKIEPDKIERCKLVCEMYGPVQQIRAYEGFLDLEKKNDPSCSNGLPEISRNDGLGEFSDVVSTSDDSSCSNDSPEISRNDSSVESSDVVTFTTAESSNLQHASLEEPESNVSLSLKISVRHKYSKYYVYRVEEITVNNLPTDSPSISDSPAVCSDTVTNEICQICMDVNADTVIVPCGHLICCYECASRITTRCGTQCPICRTEIRTCHKVYNRIPKCKNCINSANVVLLPCGDMSLCDRCLPIAVKCPICAMFVDGGQKVIYV